MLVDLIEGSCYLGYSLMCGYRAIYVCSFNTSGDKVNLLKYQVDVTLPNKLGLYFSIKSRGSYTFH